MKRSKYRDSEIMSILKQASNGVPLAGVLREHNISSATFYKWRSRYGGMDLPMITKLKELEAENTRLKKMYAEESLRRLQYHRRDLITEEKIWYDKTLLRSHLIELG